MFCEKYYFFKTFQNYESGDDINMTGVTLKSDWRLFLSFWFTVTLEKPRS